MKLEYMQTAIKIAEKSKDDIPVGAVIVMNNEIIALAVNEREKTQNVVNHAEMLALQRANKKLENWRLAGCEMYVTLEPCPMCAAAIVQARMKALYFGAYDYMIGAMGSKINMNEILNGTVKITGGIMEEECTKILKSYFEKIRQKSNL